MTAAASPVVKTALHNRKDPKCLPCPSPPTIGGTARNANDEPSKALDTQRVWVQACFSSAIQKAQSFAGVPERNAMVTPTKSWPSARYSRGDP
eukprot:110510-Hanusia_phi.AAC.2